VRDLHPHDVGDEQRPLPCATTPVAQDTPAEQDRIREQGGVDADVHGHLHDLHDAPRCGQNGAGFVQRRIEVERCGEGVWTNGRGERDSPATNDLPITMRVAEPLVPFELVRSA
jgi:hypothetical protein